MKNDAVDLLSRYIRLNTSNPPGNEHLAVEFLGGILNSKGIRYKVFESAADRLSMRAEIKGRGNKKPVIMLHHIDVVPANKADWSFDPFGGEIIDGYICGRGALDTKSLGILQLLAFLHIKESGLPLKRGLILLATADEESGGRRGVEYLLKEHPGDFQAEVVLNEGGYVESGIIPDRLVATISPGEKGPCWLKLKCQGKTGHGSVPHGQNALEHMTLALNRLLKYQPPLYMTPIAFEFLKRLALALGLVKASPNEDISEEQLLRAIADSGMSALPQIKALLHNTISLNMLKAGDRINVIPAYAEALVDMRLLPGQDLRKWLKLIRRKLGDPTIKISTFNTAHGNSSPMDAECYRTIEKALLQHFPGSICVPYLMLGTTDSHFFRERGIPAYGFCPTVVPLDHLSSVHGLDEKLSVDSLVKGVEVYTDIIRRLCL